MKGKKLPDWKNGKYKKLGNFEVIEFPLTREKTSLILPDNAGLREQDKKRVAEASLSRIVFVKNGTGHIIVREATYIPDPDYLARHQYDISSNSFGNVDKDFSGTIQVTKWNSTEISRSVLKEGKVEKRIRVKAINPNSQSAITGRTACNGILVTEWFRDCEVHLYGDMMVKEECGEWMPTGNEWCYEEEEQAPCTDPGSPQCACQEFGICEEVGENPQENCSSSQAALEGSVVNEPVSNSTTEETQTTRVKNYAWTIYRQNLGLWSFRSHEKGVHVKVNDEWRWQSLTHESISREGLMIGGSVSCTLNSATPYVALYWASMELDFNIAASIICGGSPFATAEDYKNGTIINVNA